MNEKSTKALNLHFLILEGTATILQCVDVSFIPAILLRFQYNYAEIGILMAFAFLTTTVAKPLWGILNDRFSCARTISLLCGAGGVVGYILLITGNGNPLLTWVSVLVTYATSGCLVNFLDSWALRLIGEKKNLNYGTGRSFGSFTFAIFVLIFGLVISRYGYGPGIPVLGVFFVPFLYAVFCLPDPKPVPVRKSDFLKDIRSLFRNPVYMLMLTALFICTIATSGFDNFYAALIRQLGGNEFHIGAALSLQAMFEVPTMFLYFRIKAHLKYSAVVFLAVSMFFYGIKLSLAGFAVNIGMVLFAMSFQCLSYALYACSLIDFMLETVPRECLSTAHLLFLAVGIGLPSFLGNYADGILAEKAGVSVMFRLVSILCFVSCGIAVIAEIVRVHNSPAHKK